MKDRNHHSNLLELRKNWTAFKSMLELSLGEIRGNVWAPRNRHLVNCAARIVADVIRNGLQTIAKDASSALRWKAIYGRAPDKASLQRYCRTRGKEPRALFLASTFARGCIVRTPERATVLQEVEAAIERICEESPRPDSSVLRSLADFIDTLFRTGRLCPNLERINLPEPAASACYERSAAKGGALLVYDQYRQDDWADIVADRIIDLEQQRKRDELDARNIIDPDDWDSGTFPGAPEEEIEALQSGDPYASMSLFHAAAPLYAPDCEDDQPEIAGIFTRAVRDGRNQRKAKALPIVQPDGKIRVATLHTASVGWAARAMTAFLLPCLRKLTFSRSMLRNEPVRLTSTHHGPSLVYSADLTKSTDPISIGLSRFVLDRITRHLGKPEWWDDAIEAVINEHEVEWEGADGKQHKRHTKCGALMGLGPGWTVLTILNAWAAEAAGAKRGDYAVCGDDLIGLWPEKVCDQYEANLKKLSLVPNTSKSYRSPLRGVFCERLITRVGREAKGFPCVRIGEAVGARAIDGKKGLAVLDTLLRIREDPSVHRVLRRSAGQTASRLEVTRYAPGPLRYGGGGNQKKPDRLAVLSYARFGPTLAYKAESEISELRRELRLVPGRSNGVPAEDVLTEARAVLERTRRLRTTEKSPKPEQIPAKSIRRLTSSRRAKARALLKDCNGSLITAIKSVLATSSYVRQRSNLTRNVLHAIRHRAYTKAIRLMSRSWRACLDPVESQRALSSFLGGVSDTTARLNLNLAPAPKAWSSDAVK